MKQLSQILTLSAALLFCFGYWGCFTESGRVQYDEMNGMYPFFALIAACLLFLIALILFLIYKFKK